MVEGPRATSKVLERALARALVLEVGAIIPMAITWAVLGVVDLRLYLALHLPRMLLMRLHMRRLLAPIRRWQALGEAASDRDCVTADETIQRLFARFLPGYALGWLAVPGLSLLANVFGLSDARPLAPAELIASGALLLIGVTINPTLHWPHCRQLSNDLMRALGPALVARRLRPQRPRASLARELPLVALSVVLAIVSTLGAVTIQLRSQVIRERTGAELREALTREAAQLGAPGSSLARPPAVSDPLDGPTLVPVDRVPPTLLTAAPGEDPRAPRSNFDARRELVLAALPLDGQRWLLLERRPPEQLGISLLILISLTLVVLVLSAQIIGSLTRVMLEPLALLDRATRNMVEAGEIGALVRATPVRADEVGSLTTNFNDMLDMLEELATAAKAIAAGDLRVALEHPGELHDAFRAMLAQLHDMVARLQTTTLEVSSAAAEIHAAMQEQEAAAHQNTSGVEALRQTTAGLANAAVEINEVAAKVLHDAEQSLATTDAMVTRINELSEQTGGIRELLALISEVADRSDLLALNGSLEAARAGEAGRGFAIVAAEMRRLAERVTGTVADVRDRVAAIESATTTTVAATEHSRKLAQDTAEAARMISTLTQTQNAGAAEASATAQSMAAFVIASSSSTSQTSAAADGLRRQVEALERTTREFKLRGEP
ncbi:methyl-accepting chemotaxis protein [Pseudenhygromyxa sp. WMMC2535]|uniref:methyl-accepting chemotaxis protein n=1 Tax=Pseudenhygromyxa sp. WMMC2535 TaxID=2712867 RepID=UPI001555FBA8|nr:methyl-accepting chemotaxis protein [Pseudenhygromyxa sp. WMMC2535]NVB39515.1 methyl-accepting chemotaxis protein [Pseudenhygromyxa sp. WMMC2535]